MKSMRLRDFTGGAVGGTLKTRRGTGSMPMTAGNETHPAHPTSGSRGDHFKEKAMFNITKNRLAVGVIALAAFGGASPAMAGQCPAGQEAANPLADRATQPKAVTDDVLGSIDLGKEIGVQGRDLRLRKLVVQPGGVVPFHSHEGRPALIITVSGEITEYRTTCGVPITHRAGELSRETNEVGHYWKNNGTVAAVLLSADVKAAE
jgi:quercetin dioxygenase-like cupin family protein